ncbi:MAG: choice-of-anchor Q domain-containing protein, partial [Gammaproteobacteria bacterium]
YGSCFRVWHGGHITVKNGVCREAMGEGIAFYGGGPGGGGEPGIQINNNTVERFEIFDTGRAWVDGGGFGNNLGMSIILKNCNDCVVRGNRVRNSYGSAISVTTSENPGLQSNNVLVEQNTISNFGYLDRAFGGRDSAGIHFEPQTNNGIRGGIILNNEIYGGAVTHEEWSNGIRVSAGGWTPVTGLLIINNSMNDLNGACIDLQENPAPATIRNNAMHNCSKQGPTCGGARCNLYVDPSNHTHTNNSYWAAGGSDVVVNIWGGSQFTRTSVLSYEASAVQADPLYVSPTDLRLQGASPLIDAGSDADCPAADRDGVPRPIDGRCDVGAFENVITVKIDIRPGSSPNLVNLRVQDAVPVAIFSDETFDATTVDPATVTLASALGKLRGYGRHTAVVQDVNSDGRRDLLLHVSTSAHQLNETDAEAVLMGKTYAGRTIRGLDTIRVLP